MLSSRNPHTSSLSSIRTAWVETGRWFALAPAAILALNAILSLPLPVLNQLSTDTKWLIGVASVLAGGLMDLLRKSIHASAEIHQVLTHLETNSRHSLAIRDREDAHSHLAHRLTKADKSIRVIDTTPGKPGLRNKKYLSQRDALLGRGVNHERIALVRSEEDLEAVLEMAKETDSYNFRMGCFLESDAEAPLFSSLIIDDDEVHLGAGWLGDPGRDSFDLEIQSLEAAQRFDYYFSVLFNRSQILRDRHGFNQKVADQLRKDFSHRSPVQVFQSGYPDDEHLVASLSSAESLDIVSYPQLSRPTDKRRIYFASLRDAIVDENLKHRRIIWNRNQARFIHEWLKSDEQLRGSGHLEIRYIDPGSLDKPIFYFDLLDRSSVILAQDLMGEYWVQIRERNFSKLLSDYFEMLWEKAKRGRVKDNHRDYDDVDFDLLEKVTKNEGART